MCASFPEGNAAKWVNTCQMSRQKGSQRECSLKWRCRAKNMGFLLIFFICTTETTFSNPKWTYTKRGENVYRENFWKMSHQKYEEEDCRKQKAPRGVSL